MKNLFRTLGLLAAGMVVGKVLTDRNVEEGDVVYENDDMYVRASNNKSGGYSDAKVIYKKPIK